MNRVAKAFIVVLIVTFAIVYVSIGSPSSIAHGSFIIVISETISTTSQEGNSSLITLGTTASVHVFTPNASTATVEAEEVQVEVIVHSNESHLEEARPVLIFSGAFIAAALLIIFRNRLSRR